MRRNTLYFSIYFSLLVFIIYVFMSFINIETNHGKERFQKTKELQTIVGLQNSSISFKTKQQTCKNSFSLDEIEISFLNGWQIVEDGIELYLYSAYLDSRLHIKRIRIISMKKGVHSLKLFCKIWRKNKKSSVTELEELEMWVKKWDFSGPEIYYHPFLLSCSAPEDAIAVSIITKPCQKPKNLFYLEKIASKQSSLKDFVICLKPLNFHEDRTFRILEWLEFQFLLGVDNIFIYVDTMHPNAWKLLKHYEKLGKVILKKYTVPINYKEEISLQNQYKNVWQKRRHEIIIYNDCFYRHIHSHKFVVNIDLDEAIIPVIHNSWTDLLNNVRTKHPKIFNSASLAAPNVYFFDSFGESEDTSIPKFMHMLRHVYRSANFTPPGFAQKSFFSTNATLIVSNHYALQIMRADHRVMSSLGKQFAYLHHYRSNCPPLMEEDCYKNYMKYHVKDTLIWKFKNSLIKNVENKIRELKYQVEILS